MSVDKNSVIAALSPPLPNEVITKLLDSYQEIKQQFLMQKYRPSELDGGRFAESVLRLIEFADNGNYTAFGDKTFSSEKVINGVANNIALHESLRLFIPRLARILLDLRNRRDVAHVGGDVSPNYSDAIFICHGADWILTELIRLYYCCHIDAAKIIVANVNEAKISLVANIDGFLRVQNVKMDVRNKALVILYYKDPEPVQDSQLAKWLRYSNISRFRTQLLADLDKNAYIHYADGCCRLLPKGKLFVEQHIPLELIA